jgi:hypothetical protein
MSCDNVYSASLNRSVWQLDVCPRLVELGADSTLDIGTIPSFGTAPSSPSRLEVKERPEERTKMRG